MRQMFFPTLWVIVVQFEKSAGSYQYRIGDRESACLLGVQFSPGRTRPESEEVIAWAWRKQGVNSNDNATNPVQLNRYRAPR